MGTFAECSANLPHDEAKTGTNHKEKRPGSGPECTSIDVSVPGTLTGAE